MTTIETDPIDLSTEDILGPLTKETTLDRAKATLNGVIRFAKTSSRRTWRAAVRTGKILNPLWQTFATTFWFTWTTLMAILSTVLLVQGGSWFLGLLLAAVCVNQFIMRFYRGYQMLSLFDAMETRTATPAL